MSENAPLASMHAPSTGLAWRVRAALKSATPSKHGDANAESISWSDAQEEASKWLGTLKLGRDLFGKTVDLQTKGDTLPFTGEFRRMVIEAARRKLVKRKAKDIIMPL